MLNQKAPARRRRVLVIASGGGHWEQLMLLSGAWDGQDVHYATTLDGLARRSNVSPAYLIPDCNRNERVAMIRSAAALIWLLIRIRPDVILTTGALPGLLSLAIGKRLGARTIWVDSVANSEEMSLAGQRARAHADLWMTQWEAVAAATGAEFAGRVL